MALEDLTGTKYIDDLVSTNPAAGDNVSEGDDHIRGIKNVLKTTFPSIDGAITATDTELNYVDGVTSNVQTQLDAKLPLAGGTMTGNLVLPDGGNIGSASDTDAISIAANGETSFTSGVKLADSKKIKIGSSEDFEIYHDGSNSYISDAGTGELSISSNGPQINLYKGSSEYLARFITDGAVELYHNNSKKIETTAGGVAVTGNVYLTGNVGVDAGDSITWTNGQHTTFNVDGSEQMRLRSTGDLHCEGDVIAYSTTISDATLKYDINPVEFALDKINQLRGVSYKYKHNDRESAGLLAQDVEKIMPSAVSTTPLPLATGDEEKEYKTLHYDSMTAILVEAIKELTAKVKKLESK